MVGIYLKMIVGCDECVANVMNVMNISYSNSKLLGSERYLYLDS